MQQKELVLNQRNKMVGQNINTLLREKQYEQNKRTKKERFRKMLEGRIESKRRQLKGTDAPKIELRKKSYTDYVKGMNNSYEIFCDIENLLYEPLNSKDFEED